MNIAQIGAEWIPAFAGMTPSLNVGVNGLAIGCVAWMEHGITTDAVTSGISAWPEATQSAAISNEIRGDSHPGFRDEWPEASLWQHSGWPRAMH